MTSSQSRTLVLCFDGTSNEYGTKNTNVVKFFEVLDKVHTNKQMVYYQPGIGTYLPPGPLTPIGIWLSKIMDYAFAYYLSEHVCAGYRYLMQTYNPGDRICLIGFSRGAYTARALAAMLHIVGLLPRHNEEQIRFAWKTFKNAGKPGGVSWNVARGFKNTFSREVEVDFVGVWDTVSSVGGIIPRTLPHTARNPIVKTFRQALALDEHRVQFRQNYWWDDQDSLEVWFAGHHADIGGCADSSVHSQPSLGNITLRWMVRQCLKSKAGILFNPDALKNIGIQPMPPKNAEMDAEAPIDRDKIDAVQAELHSPFKGINFWWILELIPMPRYFPIIKNGRVAKDLPWKSKIKFNWFSGRDIWPKEKVTNVHSSVRHRMDDPNIKYKPVARWPGDLEWVS